jgi:predicted nucleotidyltransferase component of viral defense system
VDVLIDRRELLEKAKKRKLNLQIVEKDYVLGWLLFGLSRFKYLVFKGGTVLSKVYFSQIWRLSEDLYFAYQGADFEIVTKELKEVLDEIKKQSGIKFNLKSKFSNLEYLQLKIRYDTTMNRNWVKIDVTKETVLDGVNDMKLRQIYSDYPNFTINVES